MFNINQMNDIESGTKNVVLEKIEGRLSKLETSVQEILDRGDEFNEATQEKLSLIQDQIEEQSKNMRQLRRKIHARYSSFTIASVVIFFILLWSYMMYWMLGT